EGLLQDKDLGDPAFQAMQKTWVTKDNVPALIDLGNKDQTKTEKVVDLLVTKFPDHDLVTPLLVARLGDGRHRSSAHKALVSMGEKAETAILKVTMVNLARSDPATRRAVYDVLRDVGTKRSLTWLNGAAALELKVKDKLNQRHVAEAAAAANTRVAKGKDK